MSPSKLLGQEDPPEGPGPCSTLCPEPCSPQGPHRAASILPCGCCSGRTWEKGEPSCGG